MIETLQQLDRQLFFLVNTGMQNAFFDWLCPWLRTPQMWIPLYFALLFTCWSRMRFHALWVVAVILVLILLTDQVSANLIKNLVQRPRPCRDPLMHDVHLLVHCGGGYSFISAHATNHFAVALFFSTLFRNVYRWFLPLGVAWAALIAFSQVYVGVHFPFDVFCGAILGSVMGYFAAYLIRPKLAAFL
jgi:undecaprenyl-diphosphatase